MTTTTATANGAWSAITTWGGNPIPPDGNAVTINSGITVLMDTDMSATGLNYSTGIAGITLTDSTSHLIFPTGVNPCANPVVTSALTADVAANATTLPVTDGGKFSNGMTCTLTDGVNTETVVVTTVTGNNLTVPAIVHAYTHTAPIGYLKVGYQSTHPYLMIKTGTNISGTSAIVNIGNSTSDYIQRPASVSTTLTANTATNNYTVTVTSTAGFLPGATVYLQDVASGFSESNTVAAGGITDSTHIVLSAYPAHIYVAANVPTPTLTQLHLPGATLDFHGATSTAAITATGVHTINGWIPTTPTAHPCYTQMTSASAAMGAPSAGSNASGQYVVTVASGKGALFVAGQTVVVSDVSNSEGLTISTISGDNLTMTQVLVHSYTYTNSGAVTAASLSTGTTSSTSSGSSTFAVTSGPQFVPGQAIVIGDTAASETNTVVSISTNTITLGTVTAHTYTTARTCYAAQPNAVPVGSYYIDVQDSNYAPNPGEQILISVPSATVDSTVYTVTAYNATGGGTGTPRIFIYPTLASKARFGKSSSTAEINDYVGTFSRPILITRAAASTTTIIPAQSSSTFSGARILNSPFIPLSNNTYYSITSSGGSNYYFINNAGTTTGSTSVLYDCLIGAGVYAFNEISINEYMSGCIGIGAGGFQYNSRGPRCVNCVFSSSAGQYSTYGYDTTSVNCIGHYLTNGFIGTGIFGQNTLLGCRSTGLGTDIAMGTTIYTGSVYGYNTSLGSTTAVSGYTSTTHPATAVVTSTNNNNVANSYYLWCRGGIGTTDQTTLNYSEAKGTMKFTADGTVVNTPIIWDTAFWMPGNNRSITFTVPMYCASANSATVTAAVWIVDPANDPLWFAQFPATTYLAGVIGGAAQGNALAVTNMPTPDSAWHSLSVTVPAQSYSRKLICRVIVMSTATATLCYAYLTNMNNALMQFSRRMA